MTGLWVNHPATPSGLALVPGRSLLVCDRAGLRGSAGLLVPAVRAWAAQSDGSMHQFWPTPPVIVSGPTIGPSAVVGNWKQVAIGWNAPGATSVSLAVQAGSSPPATIFTGAPGTGLEWGWFDSGNGQYAPGVPVTYTLTATNDAGSATASTTANLPLIPAPGAPNASAITSSSMHLDWSGGQVYGALDYVVMEPSGIALVATGPSRDMTSLIHSTTYHWSVRARVQAAYSGAPRLDSPAGPVRLATTLGVSETGPANGTYTIEPTAATYQYGAGLSAGWRSTSDDYYHGDGASYGSDRGQQVTCFYYARPSAWAGGLGTKNVVSFQIYMARMSSGGASGGQTNRWGMHTNASRPAGAPSITGSQDIGSLAWGAGAWFTLPDAWGVGLVNATYRGVAWGKVAGRYMIADRNPGAGTPNGTIKVTIGN